MDPPGGGGGFPGDGKDRPRYTLLLLLEQMYNQGVQPMMRSLIAQRLPEHAGMGLESVYLQNKVPCMLFMDDTTLLATSEEGLAKLIRIYTNFCSKFRMKLNCDKSKIMTFAKVQLEQQPLDVDGVAYNPPRDGQHKYLGYVCEPNLKGTGHMHRSIQKAKVKLAISGAVGKQLGAEIGHMYANTHVMPHVLYANEFVVDRQHERKLNEVQNKLTGQVYGVGKTAKWWTKEPPLCLKSMAWHRPHLPWSLEVKKRAAGTWAKLAATATGRAAAGALAPTLWASQQQHGHVDPMLELGRATCERWRLPSRLPQRKAARKKWKKRREAAARQEHRREWEAYVTDVTTPRPLDTMMRRTLTCGDEANGWLSIMERSDTAMRTPVQRVAAVIKAKLGSFAHTKMAIKRRAPPRAWSKVPQHMQHQLLQCQCGRGQQDAYHLWCECTHSEQVMIEACDAIHHRWPAVAQLPGWQVYGARERVKRILTLNEWALNDDQRLLKGRAASIVVGAMEMYNNELELRNLGLQRQILTHAAFATDSQLYSNSVA